MMRFSTLLASVAIMATGTQAASAQAGASIAAPADFRTETDALVQAAFPADGPGAAVIVTRGGRVIYSAGRGLADVEAGRPITPGTLFKLGSIAKQFTAAMILQLVAEKQISLDDPISRFFPDFPPPGGAATVRQLLNHSSGIQDYTKIPGWMAQATRRAWTTAELVAVVRSAPAKSAPGEGWEYNNSGYMMLGAIAEKVTGKAWHQVLAERITGPLGLKTIEYAPVGEGRPAMARGYSADGGQQKPASPVHMSVAHAAGGLVGSAGDLARWADALHHGRVVSPALYQEMIRPARLSDGSTHPYGFGLRLLKVRGVPALAHGGSGRGLDTDSLYIPSADLFVAVFANSDDPATDPSILSRRLAALALGQPIPTFSRAELSLPDVEPLFGAYQREGAPALRFFGRDGKLYLAHGDEEMEAFAAGGGRFFFGPQRLAWIRFDRQPGGAPVMEMHSPEDAEPQRVVRTGPVPPPLAIQPTVLRSYAGTYATETVVVTVALDENGHLTIQPAGGRAMPMRAVSETEFRVDEAGFRLVFHPEEGEVNRLTLYRGARELHGKRTGR